ncbi:MAG: HAMP domain-containing sensor histidine kinase [Pseudomonadota bacterium]
MNTFYLRLLLAFLVANFVVLGISILGTRVFLDSDGNRGDAFDPRRLQAELRETFDRRGMDGLETHIGRESRSDRLFHVLVDGQLEGRRMTPPLSDFVRRVDLKTFSSVELPPPDEVLWSLPMSRGDDAPFVTVLVHELPRLSGRGSSGPRDAQAGRDGPPPRGRLSGERGKKSSNSLFGKASKETFAIYLGLLIVGIAIAGWIVARSLTAPLRSVQTTINRFAHGDLSARVGEHLTARGDDMGRLAGDFDRMANGVEKMIQSRDRLLHQLSHEMRSPLARLRFAIELARGKNEGEETYLHKADLEIDRLNALMDEMLQLARTERLPNERRPQSLSLDELLDEAMERAALAAEEKEVTFERSGETDITLLGQGDLLGRALDNVVGNAVKYSPVGGRVTVWAKRRADRIDVRITDQGPGVPRSELDDLFEPFYRASNSTQDGYGLGLAIVASALRAHHGRARATLADGGGLMVVLEIPLNPGPRDG